MAHIFRKRSSAKPEKKKEFPWLRFSLGLGVLIFAISFLTPYPAALVQALRGIQDAPASRPESADSNLQNPDDSGEETDPSAPTPDIDDQEPPPPSDMDITPLVPGIDASVEPGDLSQFKPFHFPSFTSSYSLVMPPLPPIIPDGPSNDAIWDINELARGLSFKSQLNFKEGTLASKDRLNKRNFEVTLSLDIVKPKALAKASDFNNVNPHLAKIFPNLEGLIKAGKVSGFYHQLMNRKEQELRKQLTTLNRLLTRHNYYDCETILEITASRTGRKALWIQADMDVVSDGTDGDRLAKMSAEITESANYQPFTSYRWPKTTTTPNPLLSPWQKRLKAAKASPATAQNKAAIRHLELGIQDMKSNSFLIAEYDPFIVIPLGILNNSGSAFSPSPGDYVVVIYENRLYPAIVGDAGPRYKIGEASLRLGKEINRNANPYRRPVSDLTVSYIVFPKSATSPRQAPDYTLWKEECTKLLNELGGISPRYRLHDWDDLLAPKKPEPPSPSGATIPANSNKTPSTTAAPKPPAATQP